MLTVVAVVVNAPLEEVVTDGGTAVVPVVPVNVIVLPAIPVFVVESLRVPDIVTGLLGPVAGIAFIVRAVGVHWRVPTYNNGSCVVSTSPSKYPCPFPSHTVEDTEPLL